MSLFTSLQIAANSLNAAQIGLQVAGNNIANANTPGYIRQEMQVVPAAVQKSGDLILGLGVRVQGIVQRIDHFLEDRLRAANADRTFSEAHEDVYRELEALLGELGDAPLSASLDRFFNSLQDVLNQPDSAAARNLAILQGQMLASEINRLDQRVQKLQEDMNGKIQQSANQVNHWLQEVARLNVLIVTTEGGNTSQSDAVGLRDQRLVALSELSKLIDVRALEQPHGAVSIYAGGHFLVADGTSRSVTARSTVEEGTPRVTLQLDNTDLPISASSGVVAGITTARDQILGAFRKQLDQFASALISETNRVHSSGQGLSGYRQIESEFAVHDPLQPLDQTGLPFTPDSGSFHVLVRDNNAGLSWTTEIAVQLHGLDGDTSLGLLAQALDAVDGLEAEVTSQQRLALRAVGDHLEFAFADDTSGLLAALGLNTLFSGASARDIGVSQTLRADPSKLATSRSGIGQDADNALALASLLDAPLPARHGASLASLYEQLAHGVAQSAAVSRSVAEGFRTFQQGLEHQKFSVSGVSIDEEAIKMITHQRAFQASARFIKTLGDLLEVLVTL